MKKTWLRMLAHSLKQSKTNGLRFEARRERFKKNQRGNFLHTKRITDIWKELPGEAVEGWYDGNV